MPVSQRIIFKIALMTHDSFVTELQCIYFRDVCVPVDSIDFRSGLRTADNEDAIVPHTRTARYGPRSFRVAATQLWNIVAISTQAQKH